VVMDEIGRNRDAVPPPLLGHGRAGTSALSRGGSSAQKSEYLPKYRMNAAGGAGIGRGAKHRPLQTKCRAVRSGKRF